MLSKNEKKAIKEIDDLISLLNLNHKEIESAEKAARLPILRNIKDQIIRGEVVVNYTFIDEMLNCIICNHYFGRNKSYIKLWKTKRFRYFNYYILEKIYLLNKLDLVKELVKVPRNIENTIRAINDLRNGMAHAFFPENLRRNKPVYKGVDIHSYEGMKLLKDENNEVVNFLMKKAFNIQVQ